MEIPISVRVGGFTFTIVEDNDGLKDNSNYGETRYTKDEIALDVRGRTDQRVRATLLHELFHAISSRYMPPSEELSERNCKVLASGLFDVLTCNPEVASFILGGNDASRTGHLDTTIMYPNGVGEEFVKQ